MPNKEEIIKNINSGAKCSENWEDITEYLTNQE